MTQFLSRSRLVYIFLCAMLFLKAVEEKGLNKGVGLVGEIAAVVG